MEYYDHNGLMGQEWEKRRRELFFHTINWVDLGVTVVAMDGG